MGVQVMQLAVVKGVQLEWGQDSENNLGKRGLQASHLSPNTSLKSVLCDAAPNFSSCENPMTQSLRLWV